MAGLPGSVHTAIHFRTHLVDQNSASWNPVTGWLQRLDLLQRAS